MQHTSWCCPQKQVPFTAGCLHGWPVLLTVARHTDDPSLARGARSGPSCTHPHCMTVRMCFGHTLPEPPPPPRTSLWFSSAARAEPDGPPPAAVCSSAGRACAPGPAKAAATAARAAFAAGSDAARAAAHTEGPPPASVCSPAGNPDAPRPAKASCHSAPRCTDRSTRDCRNLLHGGWSCIISVSSLACTELVLPPPPLTCRVWRPHHPVMLAHAAHAVCPCRPLHLLQAGKPARSACACVSSVATRPLASSAHLAHLAE